MTAKSKMITGVMAMTLAFSAQSLFACDTCGCSAKAKAAHSHAQEKTEQCSSGACSVSKAPDKVAEDHNLSTFAMKEIVDSGKAILLDARSGKYDDGYRIPGAKSLNSNSSEKEIAAIIPAKDSPVVTYCSNTKCPASAKLAKHLHELGYTNVKEYPEGIAGWRAAGGKVEKAE